jgi:predicted DNA-binding transcriptional regulator YafY
MSALCQFCGVRRTERLFALAEYLRARRTGVTAEALAERFGVTIRTIYRDLESLKIAELPLTAERGRGGGYALERTYSLPPINLTAREAAILVSGGRHLVEMRVLPFQKTLESALDKVQAALSISAQRALIQQLDSLRYVGVPAKPTSPEIRQAIEEAWFEQRPLKVRYRGSDGIAEDRRVRLRQVVMDRRETLLNCDDLESGGSRQLKLDRIEKAQVDRHI